ncbi:MAG: hypothetical protein M1550_03230 [Deltaproteobacteria bacterium]|nr:hypothetical protein [Deltaproteobacteria bacterium]
MADTVRKVVYFKMFIPDKAGEGARVLGALRDAGVNLLAFTGFPRGRRVQLDFFPEDAAAFQRAARKAGFELAEKKTGFLVQGEDRVGAIAEHLEGLAGAGISVTALDALGAGGGRFGAIIWVKPKDVAKAGRALGAS